MTADSKAIVRTLYEEAWNKRRLELLDEIIAPSHALHDPNLTGSAVGPEAYKRQISRFIAGMPDLHFTLEDFVGEKEKLAVAWTISGTHKGEFMGVAPTGKRVRWSGINIGRVVNGQIVELWGEGDFFGLMRQLTGS